MERFGLPIFALLGGAIPLSFVVYGLMTGVLPAKTEWVRRSEKPKKFYFLLILFSCSAALMLYFGADLLLHPRKLR